MVVTVVVVLLLVVVAVEVDADDVVVGVASSNSAGSAKTELIRKMIFLIFSNFLKLFRYYLKL